jgi:hypothetical protein
MKGVAVALVAAALSGCVAYPRVYWTTKKGQASVDNGKPVEIKAALLKECETLQGDTQTTIRERSTMTDAKGHYSLTIRGVVMHYKNFVSLGECTSHIQMFVCRDHCKEVDDVDIELLGK